MATNASELERMTLALEKYFLAGCTETAVRIQARLGEATPRQTGWASNWDVGIGGPPARLSGRPPNRARNSYGLPSPAVTEAAMSGFRLGQDFVLKSRADYVGRLEAPEFRSPQQKEPWFEPAVAGAAREVETEWSWEGSA